MSVKTIVKGRNKKISEHFKSSEFDCHGDGCCTNTKYDDEIIKWLEQIRNYYKGPVNITSGYRCKKHNSDVGGNKNSGHINGTAVDITIKTKNGKKVTREEMSKYCESIGISRIGTYKNAPYMIHIGTGKKCYWLDSDYSITTFGGCKYSKPLLKTNEKIQRGDKGENVKYLQWWLKFRKLYHGNIDGDFGPKTEVAVDEYRKCKGWKKTGYVKQKAINELSR